jgi:hypothetical protein
MWLSFIPIGYPTDYYKFKRTVAGKDIIDYRPFCNAIKIA